MIKDGQPDDPSLVASIGTARLGLYVVDMPQLALVWGGRDEDEYVLTYPEAQGVYDLLVAYLRQYNEWELKERLTYESRKR